MAARGAAPAPGRRRGAIEDNRAHLPVKSEAEVGGWAVDVEGGGRTDHDHVHDHVHISQM
jgi:hypothetical protein